MLHEKVRSKLQPNKIIMKSSPIQLD